MAAATRALAGGFAPSKLAAPLPRPLPESSSSDHLACRQPCRVSVLSRSRSAAPSKLVCTRSQWKAQAESRRQAASVRSESGIADEREQGDSGLASVSVPSGTMMVPVMKKGYGAYGGGATLEKSKLSLSQSQTKTSPQVDLGGNGGDIGKKNFHGGGDGGDDGGDDDDYMGGEDDGDDGDDDSFIRKAVLAELFDRETIQAVLQEWYKTMRDVPVGMRQALELGLISSAQVVRVMSMNARPTMARTVSRLVPQDASRAIIGRMMADPAFMQKVIIEQFITIGSGMYWEYKKRGHRLREEWDLAAVNVLALAACNAAIVFTVSPSRSYGTTARSDWQNALQKLPNNMFDKSYPLREFNTQSRVFSLALKGAELSLVGSAIGAAGGAISNLVAAFKKKRNPKFQPSMAVPSIGTSAMGYGAYLGLSGNIRYQLVYGADRAMHQHVNSLPFGILCSTVLRLLSNQLGEPSRLTWLGLDAPSAIPAAEASTPSTSPSSPAFTLPSFSLPSLPLPFLNNGDRASEPATRRVKRKTKRKVTMVQ
eukprot:SM000101S09276  [mRNA]  locus=s101:323761:326612:+ [translate_table: standard]